MYAPPDRPHLVDATLDRARLRSGGTSHGFRVRTGPATVHILEGRTIP